MTGIGAVLVLSANTTVAVAVFPFGVFDTLDVSNVTSTLALLGTSILLVPSCNCSKLRFSASVRVSPFSKLIVGFATAA